MDDKITQTGSDIPFDVPKTRKPRTRADEPTKNVKVSRKTTITARTSPDDVLALDAEGVDLLFEQKESFLQLAPEIVSRLSPVNRTRYSMAKDFHDTWRGDEHAEFVERFKVDRQMVGSATDKLRNEGPAGLHTHWTRPDRIEELRARGYKILSDDEARTYVGPTSGHHQIGRLGQTELVLMGVDEKLHQQRLAEKTAQNNAQAGAYKRSALAEMTQGGGAPFESGDDRRESWTDLPTTD